MFFDIFGALLSLLSTYYFIRLNNKAWMVGMIATGVNGWLYWHKGIYADTMLEVFYFLTMCYGWYRWQQHASPNTTAVQGEINHLSRMQWFVLSISLILVFLCIHYLLQTKTHSTVPFLDAATTSLSLVAQLLMCHKIIATWVLWFITDALYAFMYLGKDLPFHSALMLIYTGMAVSGYLLWVGRGRSSAVQIA